MKAFLLTLLLVSVSFCAVETAEKPKDGKTKFKAAVNAIKAANRAKHLGKEANNKTQLTRQLKTIGCTSADEAVMAKLGGGKGDTGFPGRCAACGKEAYHVWGGFKLDEYVGCIVKDIKISESCAKCFGIAGKYGVDNCKSKCMFGWSGSGCISCATTGANKAKECAGVKVPLA